MVTNRNHLSSQTNQLNNLQRRNQIIFSYFLQEHIYGQVLPAFNLFFHILANNLRQKCSFSALKYKYTIANNRQKLWNPVVELGNSFNMLRIRVTYIGRPAVSTTPDNQDLSDTMPLTRQHKPGDMWPSCHIWYRTACSGLSGRRNIEPLKKLEAPGIGRAESWEVCISSCR